MNARAVTLTVSEEPIASSDVRRLFEELDSYLNELYPPEENFLDLPASDVEGRSGILLVARDGGEAVGCGAVRLLSEDTGEIKRMYVSPGARGRRIGRRILNELEDWARTAGVSRLVLETGEMQHVAIDLYESAGFRCIPCFGPYVRATRSICYEKLLDLEPQGLST